MDAAKTLPISVINNPIQNNLLQLNTAAIAGKNINIEIYDSNVKLVATKHFKNVNTHTNIFLKAAKAGAYFARIMVDNKQLEKLKFVVQ